MLCNGYGICIQKPKFVKLLLQDLATCNAWLFYYIKAMKI